MKTQILIFFSGEMDSKSCLFQCLELTEARDTLICDICSNHILGSSCWHIAQIGHILEALTSKKLLMVNELSN